MQTFDVITVGSATQDVYLFARSLRAQRDTHSPTGATVRIPAGAKIEVDHLLVEVGGGATNAAATFQRLGLRTACVCKVGTDAAGDHVMRTLQEFDVSTRFVVRDHDDPTATSVLFLHNRGERTALVSRGASADLTTRMVPWTRLRTKWFYVSSVGGNASFLRRIFAHARRVGAKVAFNPGKAELRQKRLASLFRKADVLLLNREEAEYFFHRTGSRLLPAVAKWRKGVVVITDAARGSYAVTPTGAWRMRIKPVHALDTTGAGDAFGSGFVSAFVRRPTDTGAALRLGSINSASVVQQIGAKHGLVNRHLPRGPWMRLQRLKT